MHSLSSFFKSLYKLVRSSLLDVHSYGKRGETFWKGFRYLYTLCVLVTLVLAVKGAVGLVVLFPRIDEFLGVTKTALSEVYPEELVMSLQSGALTTNVKTPYFIEVPPSYQAYFELTDEELPHLIAIDPEASLEDFPSYNSLFLLGRTSMAYVDRKQFSTQDTSTITEPVANFRVVSYAISKEPFVITKQEFNLLTQYVESYFVYVQPAIAVFIILSIILLPFLTGLAWVLGYLFFLLWTTLVLWLIAKIFKKHLTYKTLFVLSMYALTGPVLYAGIENLLSFHVPFVSSLMLFIAMYIFMFRSHKKS